MNYIIRFKLGSAWWANETTLPGLIAKALEISESVTVEKVRRYGL